MNAAIDARRGAARRAGGFAFALVLAFAGAARAQLLEQVEVVRRGDEAVIQARFATTVRYVGHAPREAGRLVKVELQVTGVAEGLNPDMRVSRRHPATSLVPAFLLTFAPRTSGLTVEFQEEVAFKAGGGADGRTIEVRVPARTSLPNGKPSAAVPKPAGPVASKPPAGPAARVAPAPRTSEPALPPSTPRAAAGNEGLPRAVAPATSPELERDGASALAAAKAALGQRDLAAAIESLNRVLDLPPTLASQEAQELIGNAREENGQPDRARVEYELYLKLYPGGAGAERVRARLAALGNARAQETGAPRPARAAERMTYGSVSSYYYSGNSKFDATLQPPQPTLPGEQVSLTGKDQSALVTDVDLTMRSRIGAWDQRINARDTYSADFLRGERNRNRNRLNAFQYEAFNRDIDFLARVGRQSSPGVGVLGRFDGAWARGAFARGLRLGVVAGRPVDFFPGPAKRFVGASLDAGGNGAALSGDVYAIEQRVEGFGDRRAVGTELRWLAPRANAFALLDYDVAQRTLATAMLQANWSLGPKASANLLLDHRLSPTLQLSNALFAHPGFGSIEALVASGIPLETLWREAKAATPVSDLHSLGLTYQLTPRWQLGGDLKLQRISGTGAAGSLPAAPGTGNVLVYTLQAVGTSLWTLTDVFVASASAIRGAAFDGWTGSGSYVVVLRDAWRLETLLRYYRQQDSRGTRLTRFTPTVKLSYRLHERFAFEAEAGWERSDSRGPSQADLTDRRFYSLGVRWDLY